MYASHRMTNDRHVRIDELGETEDLPAYRDMIIYPDNATKSQKNQTQQRYQKNLRVRAFVKRLRGTPATAQPEHVADEQKSVYCSCRSGKRRCVRGFAHLMPL
jgi:hypothetical protein